MKSEKYFLRTTGLAGTRVWNEEPSGYNVGDRYQTRVFFGRRRLDYWTDERAASG